jgi:hypothetical protein
MVPHACMRRLGRPAMLKLEWIKKPQPYPDPSSIRTRAQSEPELNPRWSMNREPEHGFFRQDIASLIFMRRRRVKKSPKQNCPREYHRNSLFGNPPTTRIVQTQRTKSTHGHDGRVDQRHIRVHNQRPIRIRPACAFSSGTLFPVRPRPGVYAETQESDLLVRPRLPN